MNYIDWMVIGIYFSVVIGLALYLSRKQKDTEDYYLAGRKIKWWQSGASTMATQLGAISFVSAPAFVAIKEGGGLKWLCYEFGVPLALIPVMAFIIPVLHRHHTISIYEYLEKRFDGQTRTLVSVLFQLGRGLATAVAVLAGGLILSTALSISTPTAILLVGAITIIYDALGGIKVVILSDFLQMIIIIAGIFICGVAAIYLVGWETGWAMLPADRFEILDFKSWGTSSEGTYGFWPMLIGGFFLYIAYYGTDQSQVQRELSVGSVDDVRKSLVVNAIGRFPLVLSYCIMGILVGAVFTQGEAVVQVAHTLGIESERVQTILSHDPDRMVPMFILSFLPHGIIGFIFVAIMAALMSSLDSGLNSLSAVTMKDIYQRYIKKEAQERHYLIVSKLFTLGWGIFCVGTALILYSFGETTRQTTIVRINQVGSLFYGPILAAFALGMINSRIASIPIKIGITGGILTNIFLWQYTEISWFWWNVSGFLGTAGFAFLANFLRNEQPETLSDSLLIQGREEHSRINWKMIYLMIIFYFFVLIMATFLIEKSGSG
ncbi:MAG: sodium/solute symporter [bacterium]|nr:MAG: sodium/solute symporter [bacterium]